jgi:hypothetical protein
MSPGESAESRNVDLALPSALDYPFFDNGPVAGYSPITDDRPITHHRSIIDSVTRNHPLLGYLLARQRPDLTGPALHDRSIRLRKAG